MKKDKKSGKLKVLFVASEMAPYAKVGGLGDVLGSLPKALAENGIDVGVIIPKYEEIEKKFRLKFLLGNFEVFFGGKKEKISVYSAKREKVKVFLIENEKYLSRGPVYSSRTAFVDRFGEIQRFLFFSVAVFELLKSGKFSFRPDIVHAHDWHAGPLVSMIKNFNLPLKTVFTVHNLENQGKWRFKELEKWFFPFRGRVNFFRNFNGKCNLIAEGIINADILATVSSSYAEEIQIQKYGAGLEKIIRKSKPLGILNGVDYDFYNPGTDRFIFPNYSAKTPYLKEENKIAFQEFCGLAVGADKPLFGLVSRLTGQKGIKLLLSLIKDLTEKYGVQFVFLGQGQRILERKLLEARKRHKGNVFVKIGFDEKLAHKIYAASDFFLMPSLFEPCGLGQMIAMRYGAIPVARKTGGLKDTIKDGENGFLFGKPNSVSLKKAILKALRLFFDKARLEKMRKRCMKENFSWGKGALEYKELYYNL